MKRLLLMRHAKSDWNAGVETDFDRPLNYRGRKDSPKMATHLINENLIPDMVILSSSRRTTETWERMNVIFKTHNLNIKALSTFDFYHGGLGQIQQKISTLEPVALELQTILILGHNPGWEDAVSWLSGIDIRVTTANIAVLEHPLDDWSQSICKTNWALRAHFQPKKI